MSIENVSRSEVVDRLSAELKKVSEIKPPAWHLFVKTGCQAEHPPVSPDWWFVRAASILVKLTGLSPIGVSKLRIQYGGKKNRGMAPEQFRKSGGKIIRLILQQLEKAGFAKQAVKGVHKGRAITPKGISFVEKAAYSLMKEHNVVIPKQVLHHPEHHEQHHSEQSAETSQKQPAVAQQTQGHQTTVQGEQKPAEQKVKKPRAPKKKTTDAENKQG